MHRPLLERLERALVRSQQQVQAEAQVRQAQVRQAQVKPVRPAQQQPLHHQSFVECRRSCG